MEWPRALRDAVHVATVVGPASEHVGRAGHELWSALAILATVVSTALFVARVGERMLAPRFAVLLGPQSRPRKGHVIVIRLGQVGLPSVHGFAGTGPTSGSIRSSPTWWARRPN